MYIENVEITSHLFTEQIESVGEDLVDGAISAAIAEAKGYLQKYDSDAEFAKTGSDRNQSLVMFIKDIAIWHFINICNINTNLDLRLKRYELAKSELVKIQKGDSSPDLPLKTDTSGAEVNPAPFKIGSNPKRNNHV